VIAWALAEMAVVHPVAGSFGVYAEIYLNPWAGFTMRYAYWFAQCIAIGSEVVAAAIYCSFWFPHVPGWVWVAGFSAALFVANAWSVASFGEFEYWFAGRHHCRLSDSRRVAALRPRPAGAGGLRQLHR
jgi:L-asparagine transporter-like permease